MNRRKTLVIVEDEPDTADMFEEMMNLTGYNVIKCSSGTRAIAIISNSRPDAVILDLMMPDLPGLEVLGYLQRDPRLLDIPVIIVSAKSLPSDIRTGLDAGAVVYLTKPVAFQDLKDAVNKVMITSGHKDTP